MEERGTWSKMARDGINHWDRAGGGPGRVKALANWKAGEGGAVSVRAVA